MSLVEKSLKHVWHPCSQMKDYETFHPLEVRSASGSYIELASGKKIIDAISSWWCKSLGHGHSRLKRALANQVEKFEHVILANTTNHTIATLSEKLAHLSPSLSKVFYAGDGSCAVEIALKMSLHSRVIAGKPEKNLFVALENGYHGETVGALSVSDLGLYRQPYQALLFQPSFVTGLPYVNGMTDPLWQNCAEAWKSIEKQLAPLQDKITAIIFEPILQGTGGMKIYSQDFLQRLRKWSIEQDIHLIADECMTGIGRTGKMLACEHAGIEPDLLCLSKGLTSGWLPLSAVLTTSQLYDVFYDDYQAQKSFLHSHTYSGNALAASIAIEVLNIMQEENYCQRAEAIGKTMLALMSEIANRTNQLHNVRQIGALVAADLKNTNSEQRLGYQVYQQAVEWGALLRPLANTLYWLPPLNIEAPTLYELANITERAIVAVCR